MNWRTKAFKLDRFDAVLKVGGSVIHGGALPEFAATVTSDDVSRRLLLVPGAGLIDDYFEAWNQRRPLAGYVFHHTTTLAQDQSGLLLCNESDRFRPVATVLEAERASEDGCIPVLLPSTLLLTLDVFRYTNRVTTDSIAAYLSHLLTIPETVLVKSRPPATEPVTYESLRTDAGYVDEVFPDLVRELRVPIRFFSTSELPALARYLDGSSPETPPTHLGAAS